MILASDHLKGSDLRNGFISQRCLVCLSPHGHLIVLLYLTGLGEVCILNLASSCSYHIGKIVFHKCASF